MANEVHNKKTSVDLLQDAKDAEVVATTRTRMLTHGRRNTELLTDQRLPRAHPHPQRQAVRQARNLWTARMRWRASRPLLVRTVRGTPVKKLANKLIACHPLSLWSRDLTTQQ